jgi:hypothetical protein
MLLLVLRIQKYIDEYSPIKITRAKHLYAVARLTPNRIRIAGKYNKTSE